MKEQTKDDFQDRSCGLTKVDSFVSPGEYKRFLKYLEAKTETGVIEEVQTNFEYRKGQLIGGRWFKCLRHQVIWRLIEPDFPFKGCWEVVLNTSTDSQRENAAAISLALSLGHAELSEAVLWADSIIAATSRPSESIIRISMAKNVASVIEELNEFSKGSYEWNVLKQFLRRFKDKESLPIKQASELAKYLYMKYTYEDAPPQFSVFSSYWDKITLASTGITSDDPIMIVKEFLADIHECANHDL